MEKIDKVIRALEQCHRDIKYRDCDRCGYAEAGSECERVLMEDALECLKLLREDLTGAHEEIHALLKKQDELRFSVTDTSYRLTDCSRKLTIARTERDEARREVLRLEATLFELRQRPNDWGEYPPEFPREGM